MFSRKFAFAVALAGGVSGLAGSGPAAMAQPGPNRGSGPDGFRHGALLDGVVLTGDQKTRLHAIMQASRRDHGLFDRMRAVHGQIDAVLLSSGTVTEASLQPLLAQEASLMQQMQAKRLSEELAVRAILTPDQLATASSTHARLEALHAQERSLMNASDTPPDIGQ